MFALLFDLEASVLHDAYADSHRRLNTYYGIIISSLLMVVPLSCFFVAYCCNLCPQDYATTYRATRDAYLKAANELKLATGPYKAARDAYVAATATYTKSLYE